MPAVITQDPFVELADEWVAAKGREALANRERLAIEARIIELAQPPREGRTTAELNDGRKVIVTAKLTRTIDEAQWMAVRDRVPEHLRPIKEEIALKIDLAGLRWLQDNDAGTYALVASAITAKPAKASIEVKV